MKITKLTTFHIPEYPLSMFLRVDTDEGLYGLGESTNQPLVAACAVHDFCAPEALGRDCGEIELIWRRLYEKVNLQGSAGAEMRALSALDFALWDLLGKACKKPLWQLLGGKVRDRVAIYNTCGTHNGRIRSRPDDEWFREDAGTLAEDLLKSGIHAMKIWPLDRFSRATNGQSISEADIRAGFLPLKKIRDAVGDDMQICLELHSLWNLPSAIRIAKEAERYNVKWIEDPILVDDVGNLRRLREKISVPLLASERLCSMAQYLPLLSCGGADIVMVDLSWMGGLTEGKKVAALADAFRLPVTTHNCGGPVLTKACAHFNLATYNAIEMETVRASYWSFPEITDTDFDIKDGSIFPGDAPGLGLEFHGDILGRDGVTSRVSGRGHGG
ncbi:MAG: mandelate racemase/muconate lactonizing enzyme family protein [Clostridiales bacterium]|nr:mandelate racemase/muconate lactonizing enzyme family protein [Clostridiales bacterium]